MNDIWGEGSHDRKFDQSEIITLKNIHNLAHKVAHAFFKKSYKTCLHFLSVAMVGGPIFKR